jgi:hypothetical protein
VCVAVWSCAMPGHPPATLTMAWSSTEGFHQGSIRCTSLAATRFMPGQQHIHTQTDVVRPGAVGCIG